jgi:uncharacterized DUF497 family protein
MAKDSFEWDPRKDSQNQVKHSVAFGEAQYAFADPDRIIARDLSHGGEEERFYCFGKIDRGILTIRFTYRDQVIRIIGAGLWRKGKKVYERENQI